MRQLTILSLLLAVCSSCSTYRMRKQNVTFKSLEKASTNPVRISLVVKSDSSEGECPLDKKFLQESLEAHLNESGHVVVINQKKRATHHITVNSNCREQQNHSYWLPNLIGYFATFTFIPYITEAPIHTQISIENNSKNIRVPANIIDDKFMASHSVAVFFPTPMLLGELDNGFNNDLAKVLAFRVLSEMNERGAL